MKTKNLFLSLAAGLMCTVGFGQAVSADGSPHNFLNAGSGAKNFSTEICNVCHTPHNAPSGVLPLWDHSGSATATFTQYSSVTLDGAYSVANNVSASSKLCLGCHDGASYMDAYGGDAGTIANVMTDAVAGDFGSDLSDDHPISIDYAVGDGTGGTDAGLRALAFTTSLGGTLEDDMLLGGSTVECTSCHSLHSPAASTKLLKVTNAASALCLTCHIK